MIELRLKDPNATFVSYKEASRILGLSTLTVRKFVESGEIIAIKIGLKSVRIDVSSIRRFVEARRIIARKPAA
jgi:excisionase family DNA binding protein